MKKYWLKKIFAVSCVEIDVSGGRFTHADQADLTYNTGDVRQAGCLIASHGKAHAELGERATRAMAEIDPGFVV